MDGVINRRDWTSDAGDSLDGLVTEATRSGRCLAGFHNLNYVLDHAGPHAAALGLEPDLPVKVRVPRPGQLRVVERTWPDEAVVLKALNRIAILDTPRLYAVRGQICVHEFIHGRTLAEVSAPGERLDTRLATDLAHQLALFTRVDPDELPPLPDEVAPSGDTSGFLRDRVDFTEHDVRRANWNRYGSLFEALGVPAGALGAFRRRLPAFAPRPFALLHGDLHRANVIVRDDGDLALVDWELAGWGDPLHDLAVHLVRMKYTDWQLFDVIAQWRAAARRASSAGLDQDLPHYLAYERAQSLYADTMRAADSLGAYPGPGEVGAAVHQVRTALEVAAGPLHLTRLPDATRIEQSLLDWVRARRDSGDSA